MTQTLTRTDFEITSDPGFRLGVRETSSVSAASSVPVLLLHGARVPGLPSFDIPVPGYSLPDDLASAGHVVWNLDARGYGRSTRPEAMSRDPGSSPPLVRSAEVVRDVAATVEALRERHGVRQVALLGWATGGHWLGHYASVYNDRVSHLVLYNTLYGGTTEHPSLGRGSDLEDPEHPGQFNARGLGAWRAGTAMSLLSGWDASIPVADKATWRDPAVAEAYVAGALASDPTSQERDPPSFRSPAGSLEDSFYLASGRQLWDASLLTAHALILRSERDFWSRPEDVEVLQRHLVHAASVRTVTLPDATHFAHLDRPERGRARFLEAVLAFLATA
jgi:pimeloyl-ACP methyl ester carboxylesterase